MTTAKYTAEALLQLRQSPLCIKPPNLPPAEQWMGPPIENNNRNQTRTGTERTKTNPDGSFSLDSSNRRSVGDRRNLSASEDLVLGPPKTSFASASSLRTPGSRVGGDIEKTFRDSDPRDRFGPRSRGEQNDGNDYNGGNSYGNNNDRSRDNRNPNYRRRGDADQDSDGWSTVKPRKSFGHDGAERFHGRMGGNTGNFGGGDRFGRDDRKPRDRDEGDNTGRDRPRRTFDRDGRDRDGGEDNDGSRRNGLGSRGPWFKDNNIINNGGASDDRPERGERPDRNAQRERIERTKNWRERDPENQPPDNYRERNHDRGGFDRRWGGDRNRDDHQHHHRHEREPEWMGANVGGGSGGSSGGGGFMEEKTSGHTAEDLLRFMAEMKNGDKNAAGDAGAGRSAKDPSPAIEPGPDRFFEQFSKTLKTEDSNVASDGRKETIVMKSAKTSSRFTSFFSSQEDNKRQAEPPVSIVQAPLLPSPSNGGPPPDAAEKEAFQMLLQKLRGQTLGGPSSATAAPSGTPGNVGGPGHSNGTTPSATAFHEPSSGAAFSAPQEARQRSAVASPDQVPQHPPPQQQQPQQLGMERRDDPRFRGGPPQGQVPASQHFIQEILMQRGPPLSAAQSPPPAVRSEQMLQELLVQRQQAASQEGSSVRMPPGMGPGQPGPGQGGPPPNIPVPNAQTEFLMKLMQSHRNMPEPPRRQEELLMRMPQPQKQVNIPQIPDREAEMVEFSQRERLGPQGQPGIRPPPGQGPPGLFIDEQFHRQEAEGRGHQQQPTQILQRPIPPPGLEQTIQGPPPPSLQGGAGNRVPQMQPLPQQQQQQQPQQQQQQPPSQQQQQMPMIPPPGLPPHLNPHLMMQLRGMPNLPNMLPNGPNMGNMPNLPMPMPSMPPGIPMFPPNIPLPGGFDQAAGPGVQPRHLPPPGFFPGPPGGLPAGLNAGGPSGAPPGFLGMPMQGPPEGIAMHFDGRNMPPGPPPGVGYRRQ